VYAADTPLYKFFFAGSFTVFWQENDHSMKVENVENQRK